jgi:hypothetical protein
LESPKNELKRLGKPGCRSRKPGVKTQVWIAEKGGTFINPLIKIHFYGKWVLPLNSTPFIV